MRENPTGDAFDFALEEPGELFDPLAFIEGDEEDDPELAGLITDDSLLLPQPLGEAAARHKRSAVFTPEAAGSAEEAVVSLALTNTGRRPVLLGILAWARDGIGAEELFEKIEEAEAFNKSVFAPVSYCRMLERAGGLVAEAPEAEGVESPAAPVDEKAEESAKEVSDAASAAGVAGAAATDAEEVVTYLSIEGDSAPRWRTTEAGLSALARLSDGERFRARVLGEDARYAEVYRAVMEAMAGEGTAREVLCELAETYPVTRQPRKMGSYFIDVLESVDAARWADGLWALTPLGERLLPEMRMAAEAAAADAAAGATIDEMKEDGR